MATHFCVRERLTYPSRLEVSKLGGEGNLANIGMAQRNRSTAGSNASSEGPEGTAAGQTEVEQTEVRATRRKPAPCRLELMLARAQVVIAHMAPADPRARLLQVAMLRRDEILLEALLRRLDASSF